MKTHQTIFAALTILILWNLILPGYIFSLDMIPKNQLDAKTYIYNLHDSTNSNMPLYLILSLANLVIPFSIIQKILLFLALFLSFTTMYTLIPTKSEIPKYFGALIYTINPFVYARFLAGHINLLLAYSITPLAVIYILKFAKKPDKKNTIMTALIIALTGILNLHNLFLTLLLFAAILAAKPKRTYIKPTLKIIALLLLINAYWLVPQTRSSSIDMITQNDIPIFQSKPSLSFNTALTLASMHGFWRGGCDYSKDHIPYWPLLFLIILFLSVHGYIHTKTPYKHAFAAIWLISIILATGITGYYRDIYLFLYNNLFFFKGFREPQKFIALVTLAYAYLGSLGINQIIKEKTKLKNIIIVIALLVPFIYSFKMFFAFASQLVPQDYPHDYYETDLYLKNDTGDFNVLFLPWHLYMDFSWNKNKDKRIANPAGSFFTKPVIAGDNMEAGGIYSSSNNLRSKYIESALKQKNTTNLGSKLVSINAKYIILAKEVDYRNYLFLANQSDLTLVKNSTNLLLFKNINPTYRIYQADDLESQHITPLSYKKISPLNYKISRPDKKYIVFTEPYSESWKLEGSRQLKNQHINIYEYEDGSEITHTTNHTQWMGYIITAIALLYLLICLRQ